MTKETIEKPRWIPMAVRPFFPMIVGILVLGFVVAARASSRDARPRKSLPGRPSAMRMTQGVDASRVDVVAPENTAERFEAVEGRSEPVTLPTNEEEALQALNRLQSEADFQTSDRLAQTYEGSSREVKQRCLELAAGVTAAQCQELLRRGLWENRVELRRTAIQSLQSAPPELGWVETLLLNRYPVEEDTPTRELLVYAISSRERAESLGHTLRHLWSIERSADLRQVIAAQLGPVAAANKAEARETILAWQSGERERALSTFLEELRQSIDSM